MSKRAIIYTRVSTAEQVDNYSLATQLDACKKYAVQHGFQVVAVLTEDKSGGTLDRPELTKARDLIETRAAEVLIVYTPDRLTRSLAHSILLRDELKKASCELHYVTKGQVKDTPEAGLLENIEAVISEYEKVKLRERVMRGRRAKAQGTETTPGQIIGSGNPPYGYQFVGDRRNRRLEIIEAEAQIITSIYQWYLSGTSINAIARRLTEMGIASPGDTRKVAKRRGFGQWNRASITGILRETAYVGKYYAYKVRYEGKKAIKRPPNEWIEIPVPSIVDESTWSAAQRKLDQGRALSLRNSKLDYLLGRRIKCSCGYAACGICTGRAGDAKRVRYYRCTGRYADTSNIRTCSMPMFNATELEDVVWNWVRAELLDRNALEAKLHRYRAQVEQRQALVSDERNVYEHKMQEIDEQLDMVLDLYLAKKFDKAKLEKRQAELEAIKAKLVAEIVELDAKLTTPGLSDEEINDLLIFAEAMCDEVNDVTISNDFQAKRWVIDRLNIQVRIAVEDVEKIAYVKCALIPEQSNAVRLRICVNGPNIPLATNLATAELVVRELAQPLT